MLRKARSPRAYHVAIFFGELFDARRRPLFSAVAPGRHVGEFEAGDGKAAVGEQCRDTLEKGRGDAAAFAVGEEQPVMAVFRSAVENEGQARGSSALASRQGGADDGCRF